MPPMKPILICANAILLLCGCDTQAPQGSNEVENVNTRTEDPPVTNNPDCGETAVYRFDAVSSDGSDNRRIFIDFERAWSGTVTRESTDTESHQAGDVVDCSTQETDCVDAGLLVFAWPKDATQSDFLLANSQCSTARTDGAATVSCFVGQKMVTRYRVVEGAIEQVELFYPEDPEYPHAVFEAAENPLPLCKL